MLYWQGAGQHVVCVDASPDGTGAPWGLLAEGEVYTIEKAVEARDRQMQERVWLILQKVAGRGFFAERFRPARATSIESLRKLLSPIQEDV